jgi:hypothetical protein
MSTAKAMKPAAAQLVKLADLGRAWGVPGWTSTDPYNYRDLGQKTDTWGILRLDFFGGNG